MNTWIEHLDSPLVLIAFMLFIFAGVIKLLLKNNIIKVNQANSAKLINKSLNYVFILALVGIIFGFFSQKNVLEAVAEKNPPLKSQIALPPSPEYPAKAENKEKSGNTNTITSSTISGSTVIQASGDVKKEK